VVTWTSPSGCPDDADVAARLRARSPATLPARVRVNGHVHADGSALALDLDYALGDAPVVHRTISSTSCEVLVDAAALVLAVAIDPLHVATEIELLAADEPSSGEPHRVVGPPRIATPPIEGIAANAPPADVVARSRARPIGVGLRATAGVWLGAMPRAAPVVGFDIVVPARRRLRAELGVLAIPRSPVDVTADAGADLWLASAVARGCFVWTMRGRVRPGTCLGIAGGAIGGRGRGDGIDPQPGREAWAAASAELQLDIVLVQRLALVVGAAGWLHLRRPGFHLDDVGQLHRMGAASVALRAGLLLLLP
jgi:hypothetical protein